MSASSDRNRRLVLAERPKGMVDGRTVRLEEKTTPEPGAGEALVRVRFLSIDPTIRTWMNDAPGYLPAIEIGDVVRGGGIGEVVRSGCERYREGDLVFGMTGWQDYAVVDEGAGAMQVLPAGVDPLVHPLLTSPAVHRLFADTEVGRDVAHTSASRDQVKDSLPKLRRITPSAHAVLLMGQQHASPVIRLHETQGSPNRGGRLCGSPACRERPRPRYRDAHHASSVSLKPGK